MKSCKVEHKIFSFRESIVFIGARRLRRELFQSKFREEEDPIKDFLILRKNNYPAPNAKLLRVLLCFFQKSHTC